MKEITLITGKTCAVTGHRDLSRGVNAEDVKKILETLIISGYDTFLVGMAVGFDMLCFGILENLKKIYDIKLIACVPFPEQSRKYGLKQKTEYQRMLSAADEVKIISEHYSPYCMQKRNIFMVDNSAVLLCYLRKQAGGSYNTYKYAESRGINIIMV